MKSTLLGARAKKSLQALLTNYPQLDEIIQAIAKRGGQVLLVGGAVRDLLLGKQTKDLDIEVHGLSARTLRSVLQQYGPVSLVGKAYGVYRLHGLDIDWSLPRSDAPGRKPKVTIDPHLSYRQAFARRDLTMNAMGIDLATFKIIDPFNGLTDLQKKRLRAPDKKKFLEDPLRFYRVMQFISRFGFTPDKELNDLCKTMSLKGVSVERIEQELHKLFLKSDRPSLGFRWLKKIGRLEELFPELAALVGVPQDPGWHPEKDVFEHTMQAIDGGVHYHYDDPTKRLMVMYGLLCHDLAKPFSTVEIEGRLRSPGHAQAGVPIAKRLLKRITRNKDLIDGVQKLVAHHMDPGHFIEGRARPSAYKRLANKLAPQVTLLMLADLASADKRGRNGKSSKPLSHEPEAITQFRKKAARAAVLQQQEKPILLGRDLITIVKPGPALGRLLSLAYELQLERGIRDKKKLKALVLKQIQQKKGT